MSIASPHRQSPHLRGKIDIHSIWIVKAHPTAVQQLQRGRGWWWNRHQQMLNVAIMLNGSRFEKPVSMKTMEGRSRLSDSCFPQPPGHTCFWTPDNKFSRLSPICRARLVAGVGTLLSESATGPSPGRSSFSFEFGTKEEIQTTGSNVTTTDLKSKKFYIQWYLCMINSSDFIHPSSATCQKNTQQFLSLFTSFTSCNFGLLGSGTT